MNQKTFGSNFIQCYDFFSLKKQIETFGYRRCIKNISNLINHKHKIKHTRITFRNIFQHVSDFFRKYYFILIVNSK